MKKSLFLSLAIAVGLSGICATTTLAEDGAALLEQRCSVCHPSERPKSAKKTPEQWEATVSRMIGKGAKLTVDEKKILVEYLSKTYKP